MTSACFSLTPERARDADSKTKNSESEWAQTSFHNLQVLRGRMRPGECCGASYNKQRQQCSDGSKHSSRALTCVSAFSTISFSLFSSSSGSFMFLMASSASRRVRRSLFLKYAGKFQTGLVRFRDEQEERKYLPRLQQRGLLWRCVLRL